MFSGIVSNIGKITLFDKIKYQIGIESNLNNFQIGESICCGGICLTVAKKNKNQFFCNLSSETINKTNLMFKHVGDLINLERSLKVGSEISGHFVFGHVDGITTVKKITNIQDSIVISCMTSDDIAKFLMDKCSISIDGVSLTVNDVRNNVFSVSIIPHTWENTTLKILKENDKVNTEIDMLARYVFKAIGKL